MLPDRVELEQHLVSSDNLYTKPELSLDDSPKLCYIMILSIFPFLVFNSIIIYLKKNECKRNENKIYIWENEPQVLCLHFQQSVLYQTDPLDPATIWFPNKHRNSMTIFNWSPSAQISWYCNKCTKRLRASWPKQGRLN